MNPMYLRHTDIRIQAERIWLDALFSFAPDVRGLIVIAAPYLEHLRDSRFHIAAEHLREKHFGTLLVSMLTPYEETRDPDVEYDISLLGNRLQALLTWIEQQPYLTGLPLGMLAIGTIAGACVRLCARAPTSISALVSCAGRIDLAGAEPLRRLQVPLLLQVPGQAPDLRTSSTKAFAHLSNIKQWNEIFSASEHFIEPGTLDTVTIEAREWFLQYLPSRPETITQSTDSTEPS
jgi:putative phosphoribosyl transferase